MWYIFFQGLYDVYHLCADVSLSLVLCVSHWTLWKKSWEYPFMDDEWIVCKLFIDYYEIIVYLKFIST